MKKRRMGYCAACARPLHLGKYLLCSKGCGARLCRSGHCIGQHTPHNCPRWQTERGIHAARPST